MSDEIIIDRVEYYTRYGDDLAHKDNQIFCGIEDRKSDGVTCLSLRSREASRRHNIEVGYVIAITMGGNRLVVETPVRRWRIRAAEIARIIARPDAAGIGGKSVSDEDVIEVVLPAEARARANIRYVDANGFRSERTIRALRVTFFPSYRLRRIVPLDVIAFCEWKRAERDFIFEQILEMSDPETGKFLNRWFGFVICLTRLKRAAAIQPMQRQSTPPPGQLDNKRSTIGIPQNGNEIRSGWRMRKGQALETRRWFWRSSLSFSSCISRRIAYDGRA